MVATVREKTGKEMEEDRNRRHGGYRGYRRKNMLGYINGPTVSDHVHTDRPGESRRHAPSLITEVESHGATRCRKVAGSRAHSRVLVGGTTARRVSCCFDDTGEAFCCDHYMERECEAA
jgi:hypothetical protein